MVNSLRSNFLDHYRASMSCCVDSIWIGCTWCIGRHLIWESFCDPRLMMCINRWVWDSLSNLNMLCKMQAHMTTSRMKLTWNSNFPNNFLKVFFWIFNVLFTTNTHACAFDYNQGDTQGWVILGKLWGTMVFKWEGMLGKKMRNNGANKKMLNNVKKTLGTTK
jgi:hypothetical protein